jgi:dihydropteroate synthase
VTRLPALARHNWRVQLMGIVNRTPDSFFDGGAYVDDGAARVRVEQLVLEGADIIDVGAESSRPGAPMVPASEQIERLGDIIPYASTLGVAVSIDTVSPEVAEHAVRDGATIINSIALTPAAELARVAVDLGASLVLTHARPGDPTTGNDMADFSVYDDAAYDDVVADVAEEWRGAAATAMAAGLPADRIIFDPGLGFTKNARQSLELVARLSELKQRLTPHRVLVGTSRKSYVANAIAAELGGEPPPPERRLGGSIAAAIDCANRGADILRVHDMGVVRQALAYNAALEDVDGGTLRGEGGARCSRA